MGVFEMKPFATGTLLLRKLLQTWMRQPLSAAENPLPLCTRWGLKISSLMCLPAEVLLWKCWRGWFFPVWLSLQIRSDAGADKTDCGKLENESYRHGNGTVSRPIRCGNGESRTFNLYAFHRFVLGGKIPGRYGHKVGAQNVYPAEKGAFTGEISPGMLKETGCSYVICGHSERRQILCESDKFVGKKVKIVLCVWNDTYPLCR